jgi:hypothetical protein
MNMGSENTHTKYEQGGFSVVYDRPKFTDKMQSNRRGVAQDASLSLKPSCYKDPDRRGVAGAREDARQAAAPRRFVHRSANKLDFPDFYREKRDFLSASEEQYKTEFDKRKNEMTGNLSSAKAVDVLSAVHGINLPPRFQMVFVDAINAVSTVAVAWEDFLATVRNVNTRLASVAIGPAQPSELYSAKLPDKVVESRTEKSRYSTDLGESNHIPGNRNLVTSFGGMATTTQDLLLGTAKNSNQIAGYSGHIPKGDGAPTLQAPRRDIKKSIKDTYNVNVSGYTGTIKTREVQITYATTSGDSYSGNLINE